MLNSTAKMLLKTDKLEHQRFFVAVYQVNLIKTVEVVGDKKSKIDLYTSKNVTALIPISADETTITSEVTVNPDLKLPVASGQVLGTLKLSYQGQTLSVTDLVSMGNISDKATLGSDTTKYLSWLPIDQSPKGLTILSAKLISALVLWRLIINKLSGKKKKNRKRKTAPNRGPNPQRRVPQRPIDQRPVSQTSSPAPKRTNKRRRTSSSSTS